MDALLASLMNKMYSSTIHCHLSQFSLVVKSSCRVLQSVAEQVNKVSDITLLKLLTNSMKIKCALQMNEVYSLEDFCDIILLSLEHEILKLSLQNSG